MPKKSAAVKKSPAKGARSSNRATATPQRLTYSAPESAIAKPARRKSAGTTTKKSTGVKRTKNSHIPAGARSAYILFCSAHRAAVQKAHPDAKGIALQPHLAEAWNRITASEKKKFEAEHVKDKARHDSELAAFKRDYPEEFAAWEEKKKEKRSGKKGSSSGSAKGSKKGSAKGSKKGSSKGSKKGSSKKASE